MRERLEQRLASLKEELAIGERMLAEIDEKRQGLQTTMLRIGGAVQVLEELLRSERGTEIELSAVVADPPRVGAAAMTAG